MVTTSTNIVLRCITPAKSYVDSQGEKAKNTWAQMQSSCVNAERIYQRAQHNGNPPTIWIQYSPTLIGIFGQPILYELIESDSQ